MFNFDQLCSNFVQLCAATHKFCGVFFCHFLPNLEEDVQMVECKPSVNPTPPQGFTGYKCVANPAVLCNCLHPDWEGGLCDQIISLVGNMEVEMDTVENDNEDEITENVMNGDDVENENDEKKNRAGKVEHVEVGKVEHVEDENVENVETEGVEKVENEEHERAVEVEMTDVEKVEKEKVEKFEFCQKTASRCNTHDVELTSRKVKTKVWTRTRSGTYRNVIKLVKTLICPDFLNLSEQKITKPLGKYLPSRGVGDARLQITD